MSYIAHIREVDNEIQSVEEHLLGVRQLSEAYGSKIGVSYLAGLAGVLHDMGKYTDEFQTYILEAVNNRENPPKRGSVDHSTAGGKLLFELFHDEPVPSIKWILAEVVGNVIISHHSYLHDFLNPDRKSDYLKRVLEKKLDGYDEAKRNFFKEIMNENELRQYAKNALAELESYLSRPTSESIECRLMFITKYIFSTLIDADRTNTRLFEENRVVEVEQSRSDLYRGYYGKLMDKITSFETHKDAISAINTLRKQMSDRCDEFAMKPPSIYTLSIPTGGGKTLASFRYALKHALEYKKKRVIYVVPYTTIIEQNAKEIRGIIQDDGNLLEHHSNVIDDVNENDEEFDGIINSSQKLKLAKDNWDSPIIFTTMVQFLNVFYERGSRNVRRMHNLSESVIIFDEVQKVPVPCVSLFNYALNFLKIHAKSTVVLCTATQPSLDFVEHNLQADANAEMIEHLDEVIEAFTRVEIIDCTEEPFNSEKLASFVEERMCEVRSVLVILNTKSVVKRLYQQLSIDEHVSVYHLSTSMCAAHRNVILEKVREHLRKEEKVICISTQLIEAGVDISFESVIRSLAGLDSIAQAAGRCNRHGEWDIQKVYVINHGEENLKHLREIAIGKRISGRILIDLKKDRNCHGGHVLSAKAINKYFQEFYTELESSLNYYIPRLGLEMTELLLAHRTQSSYNQAFRNEEKRELPLFIVNSYRTAADYFQVIDSITMSVIAPYDDVGKDIIAQLNGSETIENISQLLRKAQQYTVNLWSYERERLIQNDGLVSLFDGKVWALKEGAYNDDFGVDLENDSGFGGAIF